jgi:hypothetical protein
MKEIMCLLLLSVSASLAGPSSPVLTIAPAAGGNMQIIVSESGIQIAPIFCVLQSTTNFVIWTSIATNQVPPFTGMATNVVPATSANTFYRAYCQYGIIIN